jgi:putative FmdB family regulatory protein
MILYDFKCVACHHIFEDLRPIDDNKESVCPKCGNRAERQYFIRHRYKDFAEGVWHDIGPEPIYIRSRRHLKEECKKHNCYAMLNDGIRGI